MTERPAGTPGSPRLRQRRRAQSLSSRSSCSPVSRCLPGSTVRCRCLQARRHSPPSSCSGASRRSRRSSRPSSPAAFARGAWGVGTAVEARRGAHNADLAAAGRCERRRSDRSNERHRGGAGRGRDDRGVAQQLSARRPIARRRLKQFVGFGLRKRRPRPDRQRLPRPYRRSRAARSRPPSCVRRSARTRLLPAGSGSARGRPRCRRRMLSSPTRSTNSPLVALLLGRIHRAARASGFPYFAMFLNAAPGSSLCPNVTR